MKGLFSMVWFVVTVILVSWNANAQKSCEPQHLGYFKSLHSRAVKAGSSQGSCSRAFQKVKKCCLEWDDSCSGLAGSDVQNYKKRNAKLERERRKATDAIRGYVAERDLAQFKQRVFSKLSRSCGKVLRTCATKCSDSSSTRVVRKLKAQKLAIIKKRIALVKKKKLTPKQGLKFAKQVEKIQREIKSIESAKQVNKGFYRACTSSQMLPKLRVCYSKSVATFQAKERKARMAKSNFEKKLKKKIKNDKKMAIKLVKKSSRKKAIKPKLNSKKLALRLNSKKSQKKKSGAKAKKGPTRRVAQNSLVDKKARVKDKTPNLFSKKLQQANELLRLKERELAELRERESKYLNDQLQQKKKIKQIASRPMRTQGDSNIDLANLTISKPTPKEGFLNLIAHAPAASQTAMTLFFQALSEYFSD